MYLSLAYTYTIEWLVSQWTIYGVAILLFLFFLAFIPLCVKVFNFFGIIKNGTV